VTEITEQANQVLRIGEYDTLEAKALQEALQDIRAKYIIKEELAKEMTENEAVKNVDQTVLQDPEVVKGSAEYERLLKEVKKSKMVLNRVN